MPKLQAYRKYPFTADVWDYNDVTGPDAGTDRSYFFLRTINLDIIQDEFGRIMCVFQDSEGDLRPQVRLEELMDATGKELYPGGIWTMDTFEPMLTLFNTREGFRGRASLTHEGLAL